MKPVDSHPIVQHRWLPALALVMLLFAGCTHGPPTDRSTAYVGRVTGTRVLIVAVHHESYRPPTGLSTFPDGGRPLQLENELLVYEVDAEAREAREWLRIEVPRRLWSALSVAVVGVARDTAYVALSGCAGNECWGDLRERIIERVTSDGTHASVDEVPRRHQRQSGPEAPVPGEENYMRSASIQRDTLSVRLAYPDRTEHAVAVITASGELKTLERR